MPSIALLRAALFCPLPEGFWGIPIILWGDPGTGKTSLWGSVAKGSGLVYERLSPAERGEGQFGVVPVPGADGLLHYPAPADLVKKFPHEAAGLIFVDEINTAPPALQSPLLGFVQLRTVGAHQFGPRTRIVAAANETQDAAGGWDLSPALVNRFCHLNYEGLSAQDWVQGLLGGFGSAHEAIDAEALEAKVMAEWPAAAAWARGLVGGFIRTRPELLHAKPKGRTAARAWPSRRSVEYAAVALASARVHGLSESDTDELLSGLVGPAWVSEFRSFVTFADLADPADYLDGGATFTHDATRLDRTLAALGACASLVVNDSDKTRKNARGIACWRLIENVMKHTADPVVPAARTLIIARVMPTEAKVVLAKLQTVLALGGIKAEGSK